METGKHMSLKPIKRAVAVTGTYTDRGGNEKKRYVNVGTLLQYEDGNFTLKLDSVPVSGWDGWIAFYDLDDKREGGGQAKPSGGGGSGGGGYGGRRQSDVDVDDNIPFITCDSVR